MAVPADAIRTREDAFRTLLKVAEFFRKTEPHSPISYTLEELVRRGRLPLADHRRIFETNYFGVINGSLAALRYMAGYGGGALINIGSVLSDQPFPLQAAYSASKHAVKAATDALRMEIRHDRLPVSVTLIKPAAIDTPYAEHAANYLADEPTNPPPQYVPEMVARAILHAAEHPVRELFVGGAGPMFSLMHRLSPALADALVGPMGMRLQHTGLPPRQGVARHQKVFRIKGQCLLGDDRSVGAGEEQEGAEQGTDKSRWQHIRFRKGGEGACMRKIRRVNSVRGEMQSR